MVREAAVNNFK